MPTVGEAQLARLASSTSPHAHLARSPTNAAKAPMRLTGQLHNKPQACQSCQQRKRKCDRQRPQCGNCVKRDIDCVFEVKITDKSHPNFLAELMTSLEEKDRRIKALEALIGAHLPALAHVATLPTETLVLVAQAAEATPAPTPSARSRAEEGQASDSTTSPLPSDTGAQHSPSFVFRPASGFPSDIADPAMAPLSPAAIAKVEDHLLALDLSRKLSCQPSVVSFMRTHLGTIPDDPAGEGGKSTISATWPPYDLAVQLVHVYLETNSLYPIYSREELVQALQDIYRPDVEGGTDSPADRASPLQTYTLFLVFAMGCVWVAQRGSGTKIDTSLLRNRALECLPTVLRTESSVRCVTALFLLTISAVFDWGGIDAPSLLPVVSEFTADAMLHTEPPAELPLEEKDRRRRLFWSIYCLDRALAGSMAIPVFFDDKDVSAQLPTRIDTTSALSAGLEPLEFLKNNISMRYLNWEVHMYGRDSNPSPEERQRLQSRLDEWYAECPPGTDKGGSYFDWYYHAIRASLYRPRATAMGMSSEHLLILKDSASKAMRICATLRRQRRLTDNYFFFNQIIETGVSLLCALYLMAQNPNNAVDFAWCSSAVNEIQECQSLIRAYCKGWPYAAGLSATFDRLATHIVSELPGGASITTTGRATSSPSALSAHISPPAQIPSFPFQAPSVLPAPQVPSPPLSTSVASPASAVPLATSDLLSEFESMHATQDAEWDSWVTDSVGMEIDGGLVSPGQDGEGSVDALLSAMGWSVDWLPDGH